MNSTAIFVLALILAALSATAYGCVNTKAADSFPPATASRPSQSSIYEGPGSPGASQKSKELFVFAAAGTKPAIDEAARLFEQKYGVKITVNYGGGGEVLSGMVISRMGDIYIAPEQRFMDSAKKQGAVASESNVVSLAYMIPVIGVRKGNPLDIRSLEDLVKPGTKVIMGNPETTILGIATPDILKRAGIYEAVYPNIVIHVPQVTNMIAILKMNQADAGVLWHYFGTTSANDIDIIWIPREYISGIGEIQAAVSAYSREAEIAQKFIDLIASPEGNCIFSTLGYITNREEASEHWLAETGDMG